jgi:hypothetical protein
VKIGVAFKQASPAGTTAEKGYTKENSAAKQADYDLKPLM